MSRSKIIMAVSQERKIKMADLDVKDGIYTYCGENINFHFYTNLTILKKNAFVNNVTSYVVGENYNSILRGLMFDFEIINMFTDIDLTAIMDSPESISGIEEFISKTKVVDIVKKNMAEGLLLELNNAVDDNIAYRTGIHRTPLTDALVSLIGTVNRKIQETDLDGLANMVQKINEAPGNLSADSILQAYVKSGLYKKDSDKMKRNWGHSKNRKRKFAKISEEKAGGVQ